MSAASSIARPLSLHRQAKLATAELTVALNHKAVHAYCRKFGSLIQTRNIGSRFVLMFSNSTEHFKTADEMINAAWAAL